MKFKTKPFKHQDEAFNKLKDNYWLALMADRGVGKSKTAIDILAYKFLQGKTNLVVLISLSEVLTQWPEEQLIEHCPVPWDFFMYSSKETLKYCRSFDNYCMQAKHDPSKLYFLGIHFEAFIGAKHKNQLSQFIGNKFDKGAIVIDEASKIKNPDTKTYKNIAKFASSLFRPTKMIITGTPAAKGPSNVWNLYDFLDPEILNCSYFMFKKKYCIFTRKKIKVKVKGKEKLIELNPILNRTTFNSIHEVLKNNDYNLEGFKGMKLIEYICKRFGITEVDFWVIKGSEKFRNYKNFDELMDKIKSYTFSVTKEEVFDLPEKVKRVVRFELNPKQKELITQLGKYYMAMYGSGEDFVQLDLKLKALLGLRVRQICGGFFSYLPDFTDSYEVKSIEGPNRKLEYLRNAIPEIGNTQFIVWAVFKPELNLLHKELSKEYNMGILKGGVSKEQKGEYIEAFKAGDLDGLVANPSVGGYGLNLQNAGVQFWYSRDFKTEARIQSEDRSHRYGITKSPVYEDLLYNSIFEHKVLQVTNDEMDVNEVFLNLGAKDIFGLL